MGGWFQRLYDRKFKEEILDVTVISRRIECARVVVFRTDCGQELELNVSDEQYRNLKEGFRVQLTRKGSNLLSFTEKE